MLVLILSENANRSHQVLTEVERAFSEGKPVISFRIDDSSLSPALEYFIGRTLWLDASTPPLDQHLDNLVKTAMNFIKEPHSDQTRQDEMRSCDGGSRPSGAEFNYYYSIAATKPRKPKKGFNKIRSKATLDIPLNPTTTKPPLCCSPLRNPSSRTLPMNSW
jgi:hypothetical protein